MLKGDLAKASETSVATSGSYVGNEDTQAGPSNTGKVFGEAKLLLQICFSFLKRDVLCSLPQTRRGRHPSAPFVCQSLSSSADTGQTMQRCFYWTEKRIARCQAVRDPSEARLIHSVPCLHSCISFNHCSFIPGHEIKLDFKCFSATKLLGDPDYQGNSLLLSPTLAF